MYRNILLGREGKLYWETGDGTIEEVSYSERTSENEPGCLLRKISGDPYSSFFKLPFSQVALVANRQIRERLELTPWDFNPGSPFDTLHAVKKYMTNSELCLPRLYLYPTAVCNSHCSICQFHNRHKESCMLKEEEMITVLETFHKHKGDIKTQSLIVSGDGEPMTYPWLLRLLKTANRYGMRVFLTTNLISPYERNRELYEYMAQHSAMITVSIKGLTGDAYAAYQGLSKDVFNKVLHNLQELVKLRGNGDCLIGVASLILPENSFVYRETIDKLSDWGIDYLYFNQVEPSLEKWGISFTPEEKEATVEQFARYGKAFHKDMMVRCASFPFVQRYGNTVYYDAAGLRENKNICGSALFNPLVLSGKHGEARWIACRSSDLFGKPGFTYRLEDGEFTKASIQSVMQAASTCRQCRLERQVKHLDRMLSSATFEGDHFLVFDTAKLLNHSYAYIHFEHIVK
jgi:pyruvate-formate lyase-activating enzyme